MELLTCCCLYLLVHLVTLLGIVCSGGQQSSGLINVKTLTGMTIQLGVHLTDTVGSIKSQMEEKYCVPPEQQRLIFEGRPLEDEYTLADYGIHYEANIDLRRETNKRRRRSDDHHEELTRGQQDVNEQKFKQLFGGHVEMDNVVVHSHTEDEHCDEFQCDLNMPPGEAIKWLQELSDRLQGRVSFS